MAGMTTFDEASENPVEINVTAMVDVIFCLVVFFMCTFHFKQLEGKIQTWLPKDGPCNWNRSPVVLEEIRVIMRRDPRTGTTVRRLDNRPPATSDTALVDDILVMVQDYLKAGRTSYPVLIDASADVPWDGVVHVIDLCRQRGLLQVEFTAPYDH